LVSLPLASFSQFQGDSDSDSDDEESKSEEIFSDVARGMMMALENT